jgi:hypothetical protein
LTQLQRLIITFKDEELVLHALYRSQDGLNPGTKARTREVTDLARSGLRDALEALEDGARKTGASASYEGVGVLQHLEAKAAGEAGTGTFAVGLCQLQVR